MNDIPDLDTSWVETYIEEDTRKKLIDITNIDTIRTFVIYIDNSDQIIDIKNFDFILDHTNIVTKEEILGLIKKYSYYNSIKYNYYSMITYNIDLNSDKINSYLDFDDSSLDKNCFLKISSSINDISLNPCIQMFHDLNSLVFIFKANNSGKVNINHNITKKIYLKSKLTQRKKQTRKRT